MSQVSDRFNFKWVIDSNSTNLIVSDEGELQVQQPNFSINVSSLGKLEITSAAPFSIVVAPNSTGLVGAYSSMSVASSDWNPNRRTFLPTRIIFGAVALPEVTGIP